MVIILEFECLGVILNLKVELQAYFGIGRVLIEREIIQILFLVPLKYVDTTLSLFVIFQVQIYELEEHKIETWRGEKV